MYLETFPSCSAGFGRGGEFGVLLDALFDGRAEHPESFEAHEVLPETLIRASDDACANGLAFQAEGVEEAWSSVAMLDIGQFPRQVPRVLDTSIASQPIHRRMSVHRIS
jgi:hypothetical protein